MIRLRPLVTGAAALFLAAAANAKTGAGDIARLAERPEWLRLLHYSTGSAKSDITDPDFFVSPSGIRDPAAELASILQNLKNETAGLPEEQRMSCRFPARVRWIRANFAEVTPLPCESLEVWRQRAEPDAIVFVYASQYSGNPASVFGHSFLRFDRAHHSGLLGFSLSFFAKTDTGDNFAKYALKGLTGGYRGEYQIDHYFPKAHGYADVENRDLWEYQLKLSDEQRQTVFEHAWELALAGREPYYFLNRNCAFQLLRLIEVADPRLDLTSGGGVFLTPQESVKLLDRAGLIAKTTFRPSLRRKARMQIARLNPAQKHDFDRVLSGKLSPEQLSDTETSDAVVATLAMNQLSSGGQEDALFIKAASARAKLPASKPESSDWQTETAEWNPLNSHASMHAQFGVVSQSAGEALVLGFRPALHALDDLSTGYLPNTQIVFLNTELLVGGTGRVDLKRADFIDIKSLPSAEQSGSGLSWIAHFGIEPVRAVTGAENRKELQAEAAVGYAVDLTRNWLGYALTGPVFDTLVTDGQVQERAAASAGIGTIIRAPGNFVYRFEGKLERFLVSPFGHESVFSSDHAATFQLARDSAVTAAFSQKRNLLGDRAVDSELSLRFAQGF